MRRLPSPLGLLDNPVVWEVSRLGLDLAFGLYRRRIAQLRRWGLLDANPSVLDVGCGIGQYAGVTGGAYLGIDLNRRYLDHARRRRAGRSASFRSVDLATLEREGAGFDLVLMVDFLHHLPDGDCLDVLASAGRLARRDLVCFDASREQPNPLGQWIVDHDRGAHMRPLDGLVGLFGRAGLPVVDLVHLQLGPLRTHAVRCRPSG